MQHALPENTDIPLAVAALKNPGRPGLALLLLTVFAASIRFFHLSQPCLWFDESMVFWRTCGSYGQLLDCLRTDGFVPLHYSLIWLLSRYFHETPTLLRFVPALSGTLMVPAIYFLARQLFTAATALIAAAFAACSAFLLFYSRDAKMYMDAWLFVTLNMGCLLWWFRTQSSTAWLCWIASGCAACGLHFSSAIPILISPLLLFTQSTMRWQQTLLWLAGIVVIFAGPIGYYEKFNRWEDRVDEDGWKDSGLQWIGAYNAGRTGPELARLLATSTLMGWEWPKNNDLPNIPPARINWPTRGATALMVILIAALFSSPRIQKNTSEKPADYPPPWRSALWLLLWIILPVYGFYCRSMPGFFTPADMWRWLVADRLQLLVHHWGLSTIVVLLSAAQIYLYIRGKQIVRLLMRIAGMFFVSAMLIFLCWAVADVMNIQAQLASEKGSPWLSVWVPRYIGFIWPALAVAVAALLMRLPTKTLRAIVIVVVLGLNLAIAGYRVLGETEPPVDMMASDTFTAENPANHTLTWMHIHRGMQYPGGGNLFSGPGEYYLDLLENKQITPVDFKKSIRLHSRPALPAAVLWRRNLPADTSRIIIWDQFDPQQIQTPNLPPPQWKLESQTTFIARDCWIWRDLSQYRRQVYRRTNP